MKVVILGAGAVGLTMAATLIMAGADVHVIARDQTLHDLRKHGIKISGVLGEYTISPEKFTAHDAQNLPASCDILIVTTKTTQVIEALQPVLPLFQNALKPDVLMLQNGWGSAQEAKKFLPSGTAIFSGMLMTGIERRNATDIRVNVHGDNIRIGSLFNDDPHRIKSLIEIMQKGFWPSMWEPEIEPVLLKKLLFNLCLNPLGALLKCTYGEVGQNKHTVDLMNNLADEAVRAIAAVRERQLYKSGADYVQNELIANRLLKTGGHRSSMLQDIEAGRRTEILYMNGAICEMGRESGILTPCNDMMVSLILARETMGRSP